MIRVFCTKCDTWFVDRAECGCDRPRLRAVEVRVPRPPRPSPYTRVLLLAAAHCPTTGTELERAMRRAAQAITEEN